MAIQSNATRKKQKNKRRSPAYLTKRILVSAAKAGVTVASHETLKAMGYTVIAQDGWVVRKYADGHIVNVIPIEQANTGNGQILLD